MDKIWCLRGDKGQILYTKVPSPIMKDVVQGGKVKQRIIFLILRWSLGFSRQWTKYLNNIDIAEAIKVSSTSTVSRNVNKLIKEGIIVRGKRRDKSYKYAINLEHYDKQEYPESHSNLIPLTNNLYNQDKEIKRDIDGLVKRIASNISAR